MLCDKTKQCTEDILIPHERAITLVFWHQQWLVRDVPFCLKFALKVTHPLRKTPTSIEEISAFNVSTVRGSEKSSIMTNRKSTPGFPTSHRWSATLPASPPKDGSKSDFCFLIEFNFNGIKSATKLLCVTTSSGKVGGITITLSNSAG